MITDDEFCPPLNWKSLADKVKREEIPTNPIKMTFPKLDGSVSSIMTGGTVDGIFPVGIGPHSKIPILPAREPSKTNFMLHAMMEASKRGIHLEPVDRLYTDEESILDFTKLDISKSLAFSALLAAVDAQLEKTLFVCKEDPVDFGPFTIDSLPVILARTSKDKSKYYMPRCEPKPKEHSLSATIRRMNSRYDENVKACAADFCFSLAHEEGGMKAPLTMKVLKDRPKGTAGCMDFHFDFEDCKIDFEDHK
jgi:hypothetical protein